MPMTGVVGTTTQRPTREVPERASDIPSLNSLNYLSLNPDTPRMRRLPCVCCGCELDIYEDWYTQVYDGTLLCWKCSACSRCGVDCSISCRRLVCISGLVLCYTCLHHYGTPRVDAPRLRIVQHPSRTERVIGTTADDKAGPAQTSGHNSWWETERSPEQRKLIRYRSYERPVKRLPPELDATVQPVGFYDGTPSQMATMECPACKKVATGLEAYVAPAISCVCHRGCFRCLTCRWPLDTGYRVAGKHYVFCTCPRPQLWCPRTECARLRRLHHAEFGCQLEPVHPGGRGQCDQLERKVAPYTGADKPK